MDAILHKDSSEAVTSMKEAVAQAIQSERWMVGVWVVDGNGVRMIRRTTCQFPKELYDAAVGQLARSTISEDDEDGRPGLLPTASHLKVHEDNGDDPITVEEKEQCRKANRQLNRIRRTIDEVNKEEAEPQQTMETRLEESQSKFLEALTEEEKKLMKKLDSWGHETPIRSLPSNKDAVVKVEGVIDSPHTESEEQRPSIIEYKENSCQVCVPREWTYGQVVNWTEGINPCGTKNGWKLREEGKGFNDIPPCESRSGFVHITLDA